LGSLLGASAEVSLCKAFEVVYIRHDQFFCRTFFLLVVGDTPVDIFAEVLLRAVVWINSVAEFYCGGEVKRRSSGFYGGTGTGAGVGGLNGLV
jgi:hypothetical protein